MITIKQADKIIADHMGDFGTETIPFRDSIGRVLCENLLADRDLPPYHRVTMDGIAIKYDSYKNGLREFKVVATVAAGQLAPMLKNHDEAIEIMTGGSLPHGVDTIICYEDVLITENRCKIGEIDLIPGQNIHRKGSDKKSGEVLVKSGTKINANHIALAAACGYTHLQVRRLPSIAIFSSGDEIVSVEEQPNDFQIRQSNVYAIEGLLSKFNIQPTLFLLKDNEDSIQSALKEIVENHDVLILTGGVSKGKFDFIPKVLDILGIEKHFHTVSQRPGKPFWFGTNENTVVFALPGNPLSTTLCMVRYVMPWLSKTIENQRGECIAAILKEDIKFDKPLTYFLPGRKEFSPLGAVYVTPIYPNGSGDFSSLTDADGFIEMPLETNLLSANSLVNFYPM